MPSIGGVFKGIGKGLLAGGAAIAAPFTGGASLATVIPAILGGAGAVASGISAGRQQGRAAEASYTGTQDVLRQRAAQMLEDALMNRAALMERGTMDRAGLMERAQMDRAGLDLQRRQFALNAPGQRASNSVRGDVLANAQDAQISGPITRTRGQVPQISGGLRPSLMSGNTRQLGSQMSRDALMSQMAGDTFDAVPLPQMSPMPNMPMPNIPQPSELPQSGKMDTFLNFLDYAGQGAQLLDLAGVFKKKPVARAPLPPSSNAGIPPLFGPRPPEPHPEMYR